MSELGNQFLCPCCIGHLLVNAYLSDVTRIHHGEASVEAAGVIAAGPQALTVLVVAGLPRETVVFLVQYSQALQKQVGPFSCHKCGEDWRMASVSCFVWIPVKCVWPVTFPLSRQKWIFTSFSCKILYNSSH
jgi:hypothetical protein